MFESSKYVIQNVKRDTQTEEPFDGLFFEGCNQNNDRTDERYNVGSRDGSLQPECVVSLQPPSRILVG